MSWFTEQKGVAAPTCVRCKSASFVVLVKRGDDHNIYDCRKCGPVVNKRGEQ